MLYPYQRLSFIYVATFLKKHDFSEDNFIYLCLMILTDSAGPKFFYIKKIYWFLDGSVSINYELLPLNISISKIIVLQKS